MESTNTISSVNLSKHQKLLLIGIFLGVLLPPSFFAWYAHEKQHDAHMNMVRSEMMHFADVIAHGMKGSIATRTPALGSSFLNTFENHPEITWIEVTLADESLFVSYGRRPEDHINGQNTVVRDISFDGRTVGLVTLEFDPSFIDEQEHETWHGIWLTLAGAMLVSIFIIYVLLIQFGRTGRAAVIERANAEIAEREARLRDMAINVPGVVFRFWRNNSGDVEVPYISPRTMDLFGISSDDIMADPQKLFRLLEGPSTGFSIKELSDRFEGEDPWHWSGEISRADGNPTWVTGTAIPRQVDDGTYIMNGIFFDSTAEQHAKTALLQANDGLEYEVAQRTERLQLEIDERKNIERALRESEGRFRDFTDTATDWVWESDKDGLITYVRVNTAVRVTFDPNLLVGRSFHDIAGARLMEDRGAFQSQFLEDVANQRTFRDIEFVVIGQNGYRRRLRLNGRPVYDDAGEFIGFRGTGRDVTEDVRSRERLMDLSAAINAMPEPVAVLDKNDCFVFFNEAFRALNASAMDSVVIGNSFENHMRNAVAKGVIADAVGREQEWLEMRLAHRTSPGAPFELNTSDGRCLYVYDHRLPGGGMLLIVVNVTSLKNTEAELVEAKEAAETASDAKSEFLASMSHELRTPLHAILGFAQLLETDRSQSLSDKDRRAVAHILKSGNHLLSLISEVLDLAKIETGNLRIDIERLMPKKLISEALEMTRPMAPERGVTMSVDTRIIDNLPAVWADPTRALQAFMNLISNAIKYGGSGCNIIVDAHKRYDGYIRFVVEDDGPGVPIDKQDEVFAAFSRLGMEMSDIEGTGIGLTIAKTIVEQMGGRIGFQSEPDEGAIFWIDLPIAEPALAAVGE